MPAPGPDGALPRQASDRRRWTRAGLLLALLTVAVFHVAHALAATADPYLQFRVGDEAFYDAWARQIAAGRLVGEAPFFSTPLFAYWLGGLYRAGLDSLPAALVANALLGTATVAFTFLAARRLAGTRAALLAALLVALSRAVLVYEAAPDKAMLVLCLTALALAAAAWAGDGPSARRWALAGAALGLAALAHVLVLVLAPAVLLALVLDPSRRGRALGRGAAYLAGAALAIAPATAHNLAAGGEWIPVCSNGGHNLYLGNHAGNVTGLYTSPPFSRANLADEEAGFREEARRRTGRPLRPGEVSAFWSREALREVAAAPGLSLERFGRKLRWAFNQEELADTRTYAFYAERLSATPFLAWDFGLPALLGLLGIGLAARDRRLVLPAAFALLYALALGAFFVYGRYRLPMLVPLAVLGGAFLAWLPGAVRHAIHPAQDPPRGRRFAALGATAAGALAGAWLVFGRVLPGQEDSFFPDYFNQGNRYWAAGRTEEALAEFEKAIAFKPGDHPAVVPIALQLSQLHALRGDRAAALRVLEAAVRVRPGDTELAAALAGLAR